MNGDCQTPAHVRGGNRLFCHWRRVSGSLLLTAVLCWPFVLATASGRTGALLDQPHFTFNRPVPVEDLGIYEASAAASTSSGGLPTLSHSALLTDTRYLVARARYQLRAGWQLGLVAEDLVDVGRQPGLVTSYALRGGLSLQAGTGPVAVSQPRRMPAFAWLPGGEADLYWAAADSLSLGVSWQVNDSWTLSIDGYQVHSEVVPVPGGAESVHLPAVAGANWIGARGVDLVSTYAGIALGEGRLAITIAASLDHDRDRDVSERFPGLLEPPVPDVYRHASPENRQRLSISGVYTIGDLSINLAINRFGEYRVLEDSGQNIDVEILTDLRVAWQLSETLNLFFAGFNIFNAEPVGDAAATADGWLRWSPESGDGAAGSSAGGAYFSAGMRYSF